MILCWNLVLDSFVVISPIVCVCGICNFVCARLYISVGTRGQHWVSSVILYLSFEDWGYFLLNPELTSTARQAGQGLQRHTSLFNLCLWDLCIEFATLEIFLWVLRLQTQVSMFV